MSTALSYRPDDGDGMVKTRVRKKGRPWFCVSLYWRHDEGMAETQGKEEPEFCVFWVVAQTGYVGTGERGRATSILYFSESEKEGATSILGFQVWGGSGG